MKMSFIERRINKRVPAKFKISYIHEEDYLISYTKDISVDGIFIYTKEPPSVGELTKLTFSIATLDQVTVDAKVVWVNIGGMEKDAGIGVQFINPPGELKEAILEIVNRVAILDGLEIPKPLD
jgi:uncharacterized protein (TIGR02266 family)